jgi:hypothetical protein
MALDVELQSVCPEVEAMGALGKAERRFVEREFTAGGAMNERLAEAESVHLHIKVADVAGLARGEFARRGWPVLLDRPGFLVVGAATGVTISFSSVPVAEGERGTRMPPYLDHIGVDLADGEDAAVRLGRIRDWATGLGWQAAKQGGSEGPVRCCYASVAEKLWVFPPVDDAGVDVAIEFSYGEAEEATAEMGADLRPARPTVEPSGGCCCSGGLNVASVGISGSKEKDPGERGTHRGP